NSFIKGQSFTLTLVRCFCFFQFLAGTGLNLIGPPAILIAILYSLRHFPCQVKRLYIVSNSIIAENIGIFKLMIYQGVTRSIAVILSQAQSILHLFTSIGDFTSIF